MNGQAGNVSVAEPIGPENHACPPELSDPVARPVQAATELA